MKILVDISHDRYNLLEDLKWATLSGTEIDILYSRARDAARNGMVFDSYPPANTKIRTIDANKVANDILLKAESLKNTKGALATDTINGLMGAYNIILSSPTVTSNYEDNWIPVSSHVISEEERNSEAYPADQVTCIDSMLPADGQDILITVQSKSGTRHVEADTAYKDDINYLDSGYDWVDDVIAWMSMPEPYQRGQDENSN